VQVPSRYVAADEDLDKAFFNYATRNLGVAEPRTIKRGRPRQIAYYTKQFLRTKGDAYGIEDRDNAEADCRRYLKATMGPVTIFFLRLIVSFVIKYLFDTYFSPVETSSEAHPWKRSLPSPD
jgi:hypothetical protein